MSTAVSAIAEASTNRFTVTMDGDKSFALRAFPITSLTGIENTAFACYLNLIANKKDPICCDIEPVNGTAQHKYLKAGVVKETALQLELAKAMRLAEAVHLFVLDIKDRNGGYLNAKEITDEENGLATFLQGEMPKDKGARRDFHKIVRDHQIGFFLCEGKLKHDLLALKLPKVNALQGYELCQLCEFIMNLFKKGCAVQIGEEVLHPAAY